MKYKESKAIDEAKSGLSRFREKEPFPLGYGTKIYEHLELIFDIDVSRSQMVRWLPEGDDVCSLTLIDQHGNICDFEIDLNNPGASSVDKVKIQDFIKGNRYKQLKPWDELKVAIDIFLAESSA